MHLEDGVCDRPVQNLKSQPYRLSTFSTVALSLADRIPQHIFRAWALITVFRMLLP